MKGKKICNLNKKVNTMSIWEGNRSEKRRSKKRNK